MKIKSDNPFVKFCGENLMLILLTFYIMSIAKEMFWPDEMSSLIILIISIILLIGFMAISIIYSLNKNALEKRAEDDERGAMIAGKAGKRTADTTTCVCFTIAIICQSIDEIYLALILFGIAFLNQLLMFILKEYYFKKY